MDKQVSKTYLQPPQIKGLQRKYSFLPGSDFLRSTLNKHLLSIYVMTGTVLAPGIQQQVRGVGPPSWQSQPAMGGHWKGNISQKSLQGVIMKKVSAVAEETWRPLTQSWIEHWWRSLAQGPETICTWLAHRTERQCWEQSPQKMADQSRQDLASQVRKWKCPRMAALNQGTFANVPSDILGCHTQEVLLASNG